MLKTNLSRVLVASIISLSGLSIANTAFAENNTDNSFTIAKKDKKSNSKMDSSDSVKKVESSDIGKMESSDKKSDKMSGKKTVKKTKAVISSAVLNLNTASEAELKKLPGIGDKLAKNIIKYRTQHGNFKDISELKKVEGVGVKTIEKIKTQISL